MAMFPFLGHPALIQIPHFASQPGEKEMFSFCIAVCLVPAVRLEEHPRVPGGCLHCLGLCKALDAAPAFVKVTSFIRGCLQEFWVCRPVSAVADVAFL